MTAVSYLLGYGAPMLLLAAWCVALRYACRTDRRSDQAAVDATFWEITAQLRAPDPGRRG